MTQLLVNRKIYIMFLLFIIFFTNIFAEKDSFIGYWIMPDKKVVIEILKQEDGYVGYLRWLKDPVYPKGDSMEGVEQFDRNNPDSNLRSRKVMNLKVVGDLKFDPSSKKLVDGWIYDSWNGRLYYGTVKVIDDNTLNLRGSLDKWGIMGYSMKVKRVTLSKKME